MSRRSWPLCFPHAFRLLIPQQTVVTLEFVTAEAVSSYEIGYKVYQQGWEDQKKQSVTKPTAGGKARVDVTNLEPATTYCFRLVPKGADGKSGEPGPELIIDTEAVGCTPKSSQSSCCVVL
jgi:hypothetical protein